MRQFRFIGSEQNAKDYAGDNDNIPAINNLYLENEIFGELEVRYWALEADIGIRSEWEEVFEEVI